jgi:hypothetical protein
MPHIIKKLAFALTVGGPLAYLAPPALAVSPRVVVPAAVQGTAGRPLVIDASASIADPDRPLEWHADPATPGSAQFVERLVKLNTDTLKAAAGMMGSPVAGNYRVRVVAKGVPDGAKELDADAAWVAVTIKAPDPVKPRPVPPKPDPTPVNPDGGTTPTPRPNPTPAPPSPSVDPGPVAGFDAPAQGRLYAAELAKILADSFDVAASDILAGKPMDQARAEHQARWKDARDRAFDARFLAPLDTLVPAGTANPNVEQRRRYAQFLNRVAAGMRGQP